MFQYYKSKLVCCTEGFFTLVRNFSTPYFIAIFHTLQVDHKYLTHAIDEDSFCSTNVYLELKVLL